LVTIKLAQLGLPARTDKDVIAFHAHLVATDTVPASVCPLSVSDVEREIMPRTRHHKSLHSPFMQGTAFMGAKVVNGKILSVHIEQCDGTVIDRDYFRLTGRDFADSGD
jgi:hypothetical protein